MAIRPEALLTWLEKDLACHWAVEVQPEVPGTVCLFLSRLWHAMAMEYQRNTNSGTIRVLMDQMDLPNGSKWVIRVILCMAQSCTIQILGHNLCSLTSHPTQQVRLGKLSHHRFSAFSLSLHEIEGKW